MVRLKSIYPVLPARKVEEAMRYYVERLGFTPAFGDVDSALCSQGLSSNLLRAEGSEGDGIQVLPRGLTLPSWP